MVVLSGLSFGMMILLYFSLGFAVGAVIFRELWKRKIDKAVQDENERWSSFCKKMNDDWGDRLEEINDRWATAWETNMAKLKAAQIGMIQKISDGGN